MLTDTADEGKFWECQASLERRECDPRHAYGTFSLPPIPQYGEWPSMNDGRGVAELEGSWYVAHVRYEHEKAYGWDMLRLSKLTDGAVGFLLPLVQYKVRRPNRAWRIVKKPLLSGRIMFVCTSDERINLDPNNRTKQIAAALETSTPARLRSDLLSIEKFLVTDAARVDPYPFAKVGTPVRVANGPFQGMSGEVIYAEGERRKFVILIDCLGQKVSYELEPHIDLEPI